MSYMNTTAMNPEMLLPSDLPPCPDLGGQRLDQPPRLVQRTLTPNHAVKCPLVKKLSVKAFSSPLDFPCSPTSVFQEVDILQHEQELQEQQVAATVIQALMRGILARYNVRVLQLQSKLASIQALKDKQLKKLEQRKAQTMRAHRQEHEYLEEHRIVRRSLRRAKCIRNQYAKQKVLALEENYQLQVQCQQLALQNDESARILSTYIQSMELAQQNLELLKVTQQGLEATCETYKTIVEVFQEVMEEESYPIL